jgi:hypothetical protein
MTLETLTLPIPTSLDAQLAQRAVADHCTKADVVLVALQHYLADDRQTTQVLRRMEKNLLDRLAVLESKITTLDRQVAVNLLAEGHRTASPLANHPPETPVAAADTATHQEQGGSVGSAQGWSREIEDEPDEVLWDFVTE